MTKVPIAEIVTDRTLRDDAAINDLAQQIGESGRIDPILLTENKTLIDGLRRIEAAKLLGQDQIEAIVSDDIRLVLELLAKSHLGVKTPPRRLYEFHLILTQLNNMRLERFKRDGEWNLANRPEAEREYKFNEEVWRAFGITHRSGWGRTIRLVRNALRGNTFAQELLEKVEKGELPIESAAHKYEQKGKFGGTIKDPVEQQRVLDTGLRSIEVTVAGLNKLAPPVKFTPADFDTYLFRVSTIRRSLTLLQRALRKEMDQL